MTERTRLHCCHYPVFVCRCEFVPCVLPPLSAVRRVLTLLLQHLLYGGVACEAEMILLICRGRHRCKGCGLKAEERRERDEDEANATANASMSSQRREVHTRRVEEGREGREGTVVAGAQKHTRSEHLKQVATFPPFLLQLERHSALPLEVFTAGSQSLTLES